MARRVAFVLVPAFVLGLLLLGAPIFDTTSASLEYVQTVSPVQAGTLPGPHEPPPEMGQVWATPVAQDPSPDLATRGKLGTSGVGSP